MSTLRNIDPDTARRLTEAEETLRGKCDCGAPVTIVIPEGTPESIAALARSAPSICDECWAARNDAEQVAERERLRETRVGASGLPRPLRGLSWDDYDTNYKGAAKAVASARAWAADDRSRPKRGVLVCGPVGVGKTRLAATATWELLLHRNGVRWVSVPELIIRLGAAFGDKDRADALKVLTGRGPLVLDDLDKIKPSTHVLSHLFTAIDSRYQAGAPLFVTTNLAPSQLVDHFVGDRSDAEERRVAAESIVSRLVEHCVMHRIEGPDRRRVSP